MGACRARACCQEDREETGQTRSRGRSWSLGREDRKEETTAFLPSPRSSARRAGSLWEWREASQLFRPL